MSKPHWLSPGGRTKTPQLIVSFDTETSSSNRDGDEVMTLRCWDAVIRDRSAGDPALQSTVARGGETAADLAVLLEAAAHYHGECWAFAHNLGFDLTVTSLPMVLGERGWVTDFVSLGDEACVFVLELDDLRLVLTDSWSWLRSSLRTAARDVGMRTSRLPPAAASLETWHRRCAHDVAVLDRALATLLDWWDREQLGAFGITGAACGWRSLRAHLGPKAVLVGTDPGRTPFERAAIYSGRKEVWQVGQVKHRWVADYDLVAAHLTTVAHLPLPTQPVRARHLSYYADPLAPPEGLGTICRVEVTTSTPCAPVKIDDDVWWPQGTFRTVLTSPELEQVRTVADRVDVLEARWYRLGDALAPWGRWCLSLLDPMRADVPPIVRRVAKGWGRSVPGRFALRVSTLVGERPATHLGWSIENGADLETGDALERITYGGVERSFRKDQDGSDVFPAVLAFVEGYLRAALTRTLAGRDPGRLLQVNTDGWWEVCADAREIVDEDASPWPYRVTRRAHERGVLMIGPNHVETPGERRLSGIPRDARGDAAGGFVWQDWPGLRWQLEHSTPGEYVRPRRAVKLAPHYCRRWVLVDGETVPAQTMVDQGGLTVLLPWSATAGRLEGDRLAPAQVEQLQPLADQRDDEMLPVRAGALRLPGRRAHAPSAAAPRAPGPPRPPRRAPTTSVAR